MGTPCFGWGFTSHMQLAHSRGGVPSLCPNLPSFLLPSTSLCRDAQSCGIHFLQVMCFGKCSTLAQSDTLALRETLGIMGPILHRRKPGSRGAE